MSTEPISPAELNSDPTNIVESTEATIYAGLVYYEQYGVEDLVTFTAARKLNVLLQYIEERYPQAEIGQTINFSFKDRRGSVELVFDNTPQEKPFTGWTIEPHLKPSRLYQDDIDNFGTDPDPPTCLISVYGSPTPDTVSSLHYAVPLEGAVHPITLYINRVLRTSPPSSATGTISTGAAGIVIGDPLSTTSTESPDEKSDSTGFKEIDQKYLKEAMEAEGSVQSLVTKAFVQGEARVGKTSVKCLIVSEKYIDESSTGCIEAPCVAVRCYEKNEKSKCWERVDEKEMEVKVIKSLQSDAKKISESPTTSSSESQPAASDPTGHSHMPTTIAVAKPAASSSSGPIVDAVKEFYEKCSKVQTNEGYSLHDRHQHWLYFVDSGGQIQFQKLLPAFMPCASVLLLVFDLTKKLSAKSCQEFQGIDQQKLKLTGHSMKVKEIIKQLLSAVASNAHRYRSVIRNLSYKSKIGNLSKCIEPPPNNKLQIVTVATHCGECSDKEVKEAKLRKVKKKLNKYFNSVESTCRAERDTELDLVIHEVDGRKARNIDPNDPVDEVEKIAEILVDNACEINVPLKWYCFDILLHEVAKKGCGVLRLSYCQELGKELDMSEKEVVSALKFLHFLNKLFFYPEGCHDLVFVTVDSLINIIKDLVTHVYDCDDGKPAYIKDLANLGQISLEALQTSNQFKKIEGDFGQFGDKLFSLFEYLLIAAKVKKDLFLIPALLPVIDVSDVCNPWSSTVPPLLFYFKNAVPMGLFCAVLVQLLSNKTWHITNPQLRNSNFSNYFNLQNDKGSFVLVEQLDCIEVHSDTHDDRVVAMKLFMNESICTIEKAITQSICTHKLSEDDDSKPQKAFYCSCKAVPKIKHMAVESSTNESTFLCSITYLEQFKAGVRSRPSSTKMPKLLYLVVLVLGAIAVAIVAIAAALKKEGSDDGSTFDFNSSKDITYASDEDLTVNTLDRTSHKEESDSLSTSIMNDDVLTISDLGDIMDKIKDISIHYQKIGQAFHIPPPKLEEIYDVHKTNPWQALNCVVTEWLKWNFDQTTEDGNKANKRWLVKAIRKIDSALADKLDHVD